MISEMCKRILYVVNKGEFIYGNFTTKLYKHMYSKCETMRLFINDNLIIHDSKTKIKYTCSCGFDNEILLVKFLKKTTDKCKKCKEDDDKKRKQSEYIKKSFKEMGRVVKKEKNKNVKKFREMSLHELIDYSKEEFSKMELDFKENYFKNNLTIEEFENVINKVKINGKKLSEYKYIPYISTSKSGNFSSKVIDKDGRMFLLYEVTYLCESCNVEFNGRYLKSRSNLHKILCRECTLCNKTFKIRETFNIKGETVKYQSKPELDLIEYCGYNGILINNGPSIKYVFNGKEHSYRVDFIINRILIEIKDNHIWHRNEVDSGKWEKKEESAIEYCKDNNLEYKLVMKNEVKNLKDYINRFYYKI